MNNLKIVNEELSYEQILVIYKEYEREKLNNQYSKAFINKYNITKENHQDFIGRMNKLKNILLNSTHYNSEDVLNYKFKYMEMVKQKNKNINNIIHEKETYLWETAGKSIYYAAEKDGTIENKKVDKRNFLRKLGCLGPIITFIIYGFGYYSVFTDLLYIAFVLMIFVFLPIRLVLSRIKKKHPEKFKKLPKTLESLRNIEVLNQKLINFEATDPGIAEYNNKIRNIERNFKLEVIKDIHLYLLMNDQLGNINNMEFLRVLKKQINRNLYDAAHLKPREQMRYHIGKTEDRIEMETKHKEKIRAIEDQIFAVEYSADQLQEKIDQQTKATREQTELIKQRHRELDQRRKHYR
ncbi:hypothetical protein [Macrococcus equi]|uniref:hypothetical protein n=1 Tax=Macrococcus equi TaxID=3395462 RepID=UPI0039BE5108